MKYSEPKAGEWIRPVRKEYRFACCDCGLVHKLDFKIQNGRVLFRAFLAKGSTIAMRREMKKKTLVNT